MKTDNLELGKIITTPQERDAIHIAVYPAVAGEQLGPGQHVGLEDGGAVLCDNTIGVVDPYLRTYVRRGERFWLFLYPYTITSLRHDWDHPAIPKMTSQVDKAILQYIEAKKKMENLT